MKAVGRDISGDDRIETLATAESFQLTYDMLRDDDDHLIATCQKREGRWLTPDGQLFSDITIEEGT